MTEQEIRDTVRRNSEAVKRRTQIRTELSHIGKIRSSSVFMTGGSHSCFSDPTVEEVLHREKLKEELKAVEEEIMSTRKFLRNIFRRIKDPELRTICRCRLVKKMRWDKIAEIVNMDVPAVKMRYYRFRDKMFAAA